MTALVTTVPRFIGHFGDEPFLNSEGRPIFRGYLFWKIPILRVTLNKDFPLAFISSDGNTYRPRDMVFTSDCGSVPLIFQRIPIPYVNLQREQWKRPYFCHDSAYEAGGFCVLQPDGSWEFKKLSREKIDLLLKEMLFAEGANKAEQNIIYTGVNIGGGRVWAKHHHELE